jgi:hypothetical protein
VGPQIIEGIGCTSGLLGGIEPYWEGWNELLCYSVNGEEVWRSWRDTCYVFTDSCATVGINETVQQEISMRCYPNPVRPSTTLTVDINQLQTKNNYLSIYDLCGREMLFKEFLSNSISILSPEKKGVYILRIFANNKFKTIKIIVSN